MCSPIELDCYWFLKVWKNGPSVCLNLEVKLWNGIKKFAYSKYISEQKIFCMCTDQRFLPPDSFLPYFRPSLFGWQQRHPSLAQLTSLATLPPADRQLREPALLSKRATVEAWLTREANTLQKYRLVRHEVAHTHNLNVLSIQYARELKCDCESSSTCMFMCRT